MSVEVRWGAATHVGRVREVNQDSILALESLWVVADGMGGHASGEVASEIAVATMRAVTDETPIVVERLLRAVIDAHERILEGNGPDSEHYGMGTTLSGVAVVDHEEAERMCVFNVGDSRIYRQHQGEMIQLSDDHSVIAELIREGRLDPADAERHPAQNVLTRALGIAAQHFEPDAWLLDPFPGDRYLVCSDGLTDEVPDEAIAQCLADVEDPQAVVDHLLQQSLDAGARDNVSIVVADLVRVSETAAAPG